jgi:hypothetical protein
MVLAPSGGSQAHTDFHEPGSVREDALECKYESFFTPACRKSKITDRPAAV